jgi:hypothetical protein
MAKVRTLGTKKTNRHKLRLRSAEFEMLQQWELHVLSIEI